MKNDTRRPDETWTREEIKGFLIANDLCDLSDLIFDAPSLLAHAQTIWDAHYGPRSDGDEGGAYGESR